MGIVVMITVVAHLVVMVEVIRGYRHLRPLCDGQKEVSISLTTCVDCKYA